MTATAARPSSPGSPSAPPTPRRPPWPAPTWWPGSWPPAWTSTSPSPNSTCTTGRWRRPASAATSARPRQLEKIGPPPHLDAKQFTTRARWITNFGGVTVGATWNSQARTLAASLLRSPDYTPAAALRTIRGVTSSQAALLPLLASTDLVTTLPALDVPIILAQGRLDQVAPGAATQRFYDTLTAPSKQLIWFEHSAHTPQYDEPAKFRDVLLTLRAGDLAAT